MKVRELIEKLQKFDPELRVMGFSEDESITPGPTPVPIFEIIAVDTFEADTHRDDDGFVRFHFEHSETSRKFLGIEMTLDY
jgi:hypothetical protein